MVIYCCAYNCYNREDKKDRNGGQRISFHRLPFNDLDLLGKWVTAIRRSDLPLNFSTQLCSDHFESSCVIRSLGGTRRRLKPGAVPTRFDFSKSKRKTSKTLAPVEGESSGYCKQKYDDDILKCDQKIGALQDKIKHLEHEKESILCKRKLVETLISKYF